MTSFIRKNINGTTRKIVLCGDEKSGKTIAVARWKGDLKEDEFKVYTPTLGVEVSSKYGVSIWDYAGKFASPSFKTNAIIDADLIIFIGDGTLVREYKREINNGKQRGITEETH